MRGRHYTQASRAVETRTPVNSYIAEALAIQAANRPPKSPPKLMPVTPTLPKVCRTRRRRRTV